MDETDEEEAECSGNCSYGDPHLVGPARARAYDGSKCGCARRPNFALCAMWAAPEILACTKMGVCIGCDVHFGKALDFAQLEECPVCMTDGPITGVPHSCGRHFFCSSCYATMHGFPSFPLDPEPLLSDFGYARHDDDGDDDAADREARWLEAHPEEEAAYRAALATHRAARENRARPAPVSAARCAVCRQSNEPEWLQNLRKRSQAGASA